MASTQTYIETPLVVDDDAGVTASMALSSLGESLRSAYPYMRTEALNNIVDHMKSELVSKITEQ